jgi:hypothetical protein
MAIPSFTRRWSRSLSGPARLRRVIRTRLIALFASVVVAGILAVGFLFNALGL